MSVVGPGCLYQNHDSNASLGSCHSNDGFDITKVQQNQPQNQQQPIDPSPEKMSHVLPPTARTPNDRKRKRKNADNNSDGSGSGPNSGGKGAKKINDYFKHAPSSPVRNHPNYSAHFPSSPSPTPYCGNADYLLGQQQQAQSGQRVNKLVIRYVETEISKNILNNDSAQHLPSSNYSEQDMKAKFENSN